MTYVTSARNPQATAGHTAPPNCKGGTLTLPGAQGRRAEGASHRWYQGALTSFQLSLPMFIAHRGKVAL